MSAVGRRSHQKLGNTSGRLSRVISLIDQIFYHLYTFIFIPVYLHSGTSSEEKWKKSQRTRQIWSTAHHENAASCEWINAAIIFDDYWYFDQSNYSTALALSLEKILYRTGWCLMKLKASLSGMNLNESQFAQGEGGRFQIGIIFYFDATLNKKKSCNQSERPRQKT